MKTLSILIILLPIVPYFGQSKLTDTASGCEYYLPWTCDGCDMSWTGDCVDFLPDGKGKLTVSYENESIMEYEGHMVNGKFDGVGQYKDGMSEMKGYFVDGNFISSDTTILHNLEKVVVSSKDPYSLYVNDGHENTHLFYYKMVPKTPPIGALVIIPSGGETAENLIKQIALHKAAYANGLLVIIPSINWGTTDRAPEISFLDIIFRQVINLHNVPTDKFIFCGLSNGGMISFRYAINAVKESNTLIIPKGIIGLDPPLDFSNYYHYCEREIERNFTPAGVAEAKWILDNYNSIYGGSPDDYPQKYIEASTYSHGVAYGGNAKYLTSIAIRMHSDLNLDFLLNQRRRDLYDWNGTDIVSFVNQLKINGNTNAEVIITQNKGVRYDGTIHPHSWSIMDTDETIKWMLALLKNT